MKSKLFAFNVAEEISVTPTPEAGFYDQQEQVWVANEAVMSYCTQDWHCPCTGPWCDIDCYWCADVVGGGVCPDPC